MFAMLLHDRMLGLAQNYVPYLPQDGEGRQQRPVDVAERGEVPSLDNGRGYGDAEAGSEQRPNGHILEEVCRHYRKLE